MKLVELNEFIEKNRKDNSLLCIIDKKGVTDDETYKSRGLSRTCETILIQGGKNELWVLVCSTFKKACEVLRNQKIEKPIKFMNWRSKQ